MQIAYGIFASGFNPIRTYQRIALNPIISKVTILVNVKSEKGQGDLVLRFFV